MAKLALGPESKFGLFFRIAHIVGRRVMAMVHTFLRQKTISLRCKWLSAFSHILISLTSCLLAAAGNATRGRR